MPYLTLQGQSVPYDEAAQSAISGQPFGCAQVRSFVISTNDEIFSLTINRVRLVGVYDSQDAAVGALVGAMFGTGIGSITAVESLINDMLDRGVGVVPSVN